MLYDAERGDMTIAVVGDAMISRRMRAFRELHFLNSWRLFATPTSALPTWSSSSTTTKVPGSGRVAPIPARIRKISMS